jgi:cephalosporin-C deacetylase-like acetyl esterase
MKMKPALRYCSLFIIAMLCTACARHVVVTESQLIQRADSLPKTTPWNLEELSQPPGFAWSEGDTIRTLYYKGEEYKGKATRVFAYYATPGTLSGDLSRDKNLPAIVLVHGGGGTAFSKWAQLWASRGYAAIAMDLGSCGPNRMRLADGGPRQRDREKFGAIDEPVTDQWTYHAVANVIRAHSLIRSFPEVDRDRVALTGISWGGYLTCIVAGIDNRFKIAVPVYGCGFLHDNSVWLKQFAEMSAENRAKWVQLWDPSMYVGSAAMPMLFINGGRDFAYPPDSHAKTYALVQSPKNISFVPDLRHGHIFDRPKALEVFIQHHIEDGIPLPKVSSPHVAGKHVKAKVSTKTKLVEAELHYTLDSLSENHRTRKWITREAAIKGKNIIADLPPENAKVWFLTVKDERNAIVSSKLMFPNKM